MVWGQPAFVAAFPGAKAALALMTICFLTLLISGAIQFGLGAARLGAVVKFVPHPVLAGFVNGLALQIIIGQIPGLFGVDTLADVWGALVRLALSPWVLGIGVGTAVLTSISGRLIKVIPAPLIGLAGGTLAWLVAAHFVDPEKLGPVIGSLPRNFLPLPQFFQMAGPVGSPSFVSLAFPILATGVTLAMISSIQSLLTIAGADRLADTRHNSNAELMIQGGGNFLAALFGGGPSGGSSNVTQAVFDNGGRTRVANLSHAVALVVLILLLGKVIALVPVSAMAAVVIMATASGFDKMDAAADRPRRPAQDGTPPRRLVQSRRDRGHRAGGLCRRAGGAGCRHVARLHDLPLPHPAERRAPGVARHGTALAHQPHPADGRCVARAWRAHRRGRTGGAAVLRIGRWHGQASRTRARDGGLAGPRLPPRRACRTAQR